MRRYWRLILFGVLTWMIPFLVSVFIFPIHELQRPLFESIMAVVVTLCAVVFAGLYLKRAEGDFLRQGVVIGVAWMVINILIDLPLFSQGPMAMPLGAYVQDIAITYLIIPVVTIGFGWLLKSKVH
jgi:hypothetical protein